MQYKIIPKHGPGLPVTTAQRKSSHFDPEPRIADHVVRMRGMPLLFNEHEMKHHQIRLRQLLEAEAIDIIPLGAGLPVEEPKAKASEVKTEPVAPPAPPQSIQEAVAAMPETMAPPSVYVPPVVSPLPQPPQPVQQPQNDHESHRRRRR